MKKIIFLITIMLLVSCNKDVDNAFILKGKTKGINDNTFLYLTSDDKILDSVKVMNNAFEFKTKLTKTPINVILRTKNFSHYKFLWLENKLMQFDATDRDFKKAEVSGSKMEEVSSSLSQKLDTIPRDERGKYRIEFIEANSNELYSAYLLSFYATTWGKNTTMELFNKLSKENQSSEYGKEVSNFIKLNKNPKIGDKYVDFEMTDSKGNLKKLSDLKDSVVLLEFWASRCTPCRQENPNLVKTYNEFKNKGFEIFAVSEDTDKERWLKAIQKDGLPWLQVSDLSKNNKAFLIYGVNGIPDNFLINKEGVIVARNLKGDKLKNKLSELLN